MTVFKIGKSSQVPPALGRRRTEWGVDGGVPFFLLLVILTLGEF